MPRSLRQDDSSTDTTSAQIKAWDLLLEGKEEEAQQTLEQALPIPQPWSKALFFIGNTLLSLERAEEAIDAYNRAIQLDPDNAAYRAQMGIALQGIGRQEEAESILQQAVLQFCFQLAQNPQDHQALANLGLSYEQLGDSEQAIAAYKMALEIEPTFSPALLRLGSVYKEQGNFSESLEAWERLLFLNPTDTVALVNTAFLLRQFGDLSSALDYLHRSHEAEPERSEIAEALMFAYSIAGIPYVDQMLRFSAGFWGVQQQLSQPGGNKPLPCNEPGQKRDRIRIAFLSAEIREHVVSRFLESFLEFYDRSKFKVELIETQTHQGARSDQLRKLADHSISVEGMSKEEARLIIRERAYDIIVETSGYTSNSAGASILAERCAPVQCHYIGYHATTGLTSIDYFIGDAETASADLAPQFTEKLWPLPRLWLARNPTQDLPEAESLAKDDQPVLGAFSQVGKIRAETIEYWAAALHLVPSADLVIKDSLATAPLARNRILILLERQHIDPARVTFLPRVEPWSEHMRTYNSIDIALDTTPWSSATTCFDALSMGVPMVAIRGETMASRMSASILKTLGKDAWIAKAPSEFAATVLDLVTDLPGLRSAKRPLQQHVLESPLYDPRGLTAHLQQAFQAMVRAD